MSDRPDDRVAANERLCPIYGEARTTDECEKCGGDLLKCPVYGDGERKRQAEDRAAAPKRGFTRGPWKWDTDGSLRGKDNNAIFYPSPRKGDTIRDLINNDADADLIVAAVNEYLDRRLA